MKTNKTAFQDYFEPKRRVESFGIVNSQTLATPSFNIDYETFTQQLLAAANAPTAEGGSSAQGEATAAATETASAVSKVNGMPRDHVLKTYQMIKAEVNTPARSLSTAPRPDVEADNGQATRSIVHSATHQMFQEDQSTLEGESRYLSADGPDLTSLFSRPRERRANATRSEGSLNPGKEAEDAMVARWSESANESLGETVPREKLPANMPAMNKEQRRKEGRKEGKRKAARRWREKKKAREKEAREKEAQETNVQGVTLVQQKPAKAKSVLESTTSKVKMSKATIPKATAHKTSAPKAPALKTTAVKAIATKVTAPKATAPKLPVHKTTVSEKPCKPTTPNTKNTKRKFGMFQAWNPNDVTATHTGPRSLAKSERDDVGGNVTIGQVKRPKSNRVAGPREVVVSIDGKVDISPYKRID